MFEWLCIATTIRCFSANGAIFFADSSVADAVMISAPSAFAISKPRLISVVREPDVRAVVVGPDLIPARSNFLRIASKCSSGVSMRQRLRSSRDFLGLLRAVVPRPNG